MNPPISPCNDMPLQADLVLEGGGVRGIGHVGALSLMEEQGYQWVNIAGTSAGAFVAALLAAGYKASELYDIMKNEVQFSRFAHDPGLDGVMLVEALHMLQRAGMHTGNFIETFIQQKLGAKGIVKFGDLVLNTREPKHSNFRYRLTVIASDISNESMLRLPQDMLRFGLDPDDLDIAQAVRMSASIPFFFMPIHKKHADGSASLIVDGGLLSNFPVYLFDVPHAPRRPTFGLRLVDAPPTAEQPWPPNPTGNAWQIGRALLNTLLRAHDRLYMDDHTYVRTIAIPVNGISGTKFDLSSEEANTLYHNGRKAAAQFFSTWDFEAYKATYRNGQPLRSRRERLHEHMRTIR
ncbi:MAG TPA: patatin-like phospholipase family protein [Ktedonobacteraceae bacterium]|nr:patatin-like phospholipase family protein [Ktedonobacteraceae bacterium]